MIILIAMHIQRFFSYLSAFTFGMLVLISGGNYFVMFVGWIFPALLFKILHLFPASSQYASQNQRSVEV